MRIAVAHFDCGPRATAAVAPQQQPQQRRQQQPQQDNRCNNNNRRCNNNQPCHVPIDQRKFGLAIKRNCFQLAKVGNTRCWCVYVMFYRFHSYVVATAKTPTLTHPLTHTHTAHTVIENCISSFHLVDFLSLCACVNISLCFCFFF